MYDACRAAGVNHFDTAHIYTGGASETLLGQFIKAERDDINVATKVAYTGAAGKENIYATFDVSQKRLQLDCIDPLYLHRFDADTPLSETFEALARLLQSGKSATMVCPTMRHGNSSKRRGSQRLWVPALI